MKRNSAELVSNPKRLNFAFTTEPTQSSFQKTESLPNLQPLNQTLYKKMQDRMGVHPKAKDANFKRKLESLTKLETFVDLKSDIHNINIVNNQQAYDQYQTLSQKLEAIRRVEQLAELRNQQQTISYIPHGYLFKLKEIEKKVSQISNSSTLQAQHLQNLQHINRQASYMFEDKKSRYLSDYSRETDDAFYQKVQDQLKKVNQSESRVLFGVDHHREEEKQRISAQLSHLHKQLIQKLSSSVLLKQNIKTNTQEYYEYFQKRSKKLISEVIKKQIEEHRIKREEMSNMIMFSRKQTSPKNLMKIYKNREFRAERPNIRVSKRVEERKHLFKLIEHHEQKHSQTVDEDKFKFRRSSLLRKTVTRILTQSVSDPQVKMKYLLNQIKGEIDDNQKFNQTFNRHLNQIDLTQKELRIKYAENQELEYTK